jgi:O-antigen/teichoic acid export membrane protein
MRAYEARLKLCISNISKIIAEALATITSRQRLTQIVATSLYRNALYLIATTAATSLLGLFFWMAVARFYSETEVGLGSAAISAINLLALLSIAGLNFSVIRFLSLANKPQELINSSFVFSSLISLVAAAIFVAAIDLWSPALIFVKHNLIFCLTFVIAAILATLSSLMDSVFVARRSASFVLSKNVISSVLRIPLVIILAIFFHTFGVVASWGLALGVAFIISLFLFLPRVEAGYKIAPTLNMRQFKDIWHYSGGSYLASLLARAPAVILPLMVVNLLGIESNAYFYIAWMIGGLLFAIPGSVSRSLFAEGSRSQENLKEQMKRSIKFNFLLLVPAVIVLAAAAKWILLLFGPGYSANSLSLLWLLILANLPRGLNNVYIGILRVQDKLKELIIIRGLVTVSTLALSFIFMAPYGMIAIGYVWLGVQLIVSIVLAFRLSYWSDQFSPTDSSIQEDGNHL